MSGVMKIGEIIVTTNIYETLILNAFGPWLPFYPSMDSCNNTMTEREE